MQLQSQSHKPVGAGRRNEFAHRDLLQRAQIHRLLHHGEVCPEDQFTRSVDTSAMQSTSLTSLSW